MRYQTRFRGAGWMGWELSEWLPVAEAHRNAREWAAAHPNPKTRGNKAEVLRSDGVLQATYWLEPNGDLMVSLRNRKGKHDVMIERYAPGTV